MEQVTHSVADASSVGQVARSTGEASTIEVDSSDEGGSQVQNSGKEVEAVSNQTICEEVEEFDMSACGNTGAPISVEWDRVHRGFIDGFGLCSPCRWKPSKRGGKRTADMLKLAEDTFRILAEAVQGEIQKFLHLWAWVLAYEMIGTPFGYHKFKGGYASDFVGYHIRYDLSQVGISVKRGDWLLQWIAKVRANAHVVPAREFAEFLGRLGFISQKPHLAPLFAWSAVTAKGTVGRLPETIILTLRYIEVELATGTYMVSTHRPKIIAGERFRTDAKCADGYIVLAGWELDTKRWYSLRIGPTETPFLFKPGGASQWASTSAELLATLLALHAFGWLVESKDRKFFEALIWPMRPFLRNGLQQSGH